MISRPSPGVQDALRFIYFSFPREPSYKLTLLCDTVCMHIAMVLGMSLVFCSSLTKLRSYSTKKLSSLTYALQSWKCISVTFLGFFCIAKAIARAAFSFDYHRYTL
jgi:hypothetical protein